MHLWVETEIGLKNKFKNEKDKIRSFVLEIFFPRLQEYTVENPCKNGLEGGLNWRKLIFKLYQQKSQKPNSNHD